MSAESDGNILADAIEEAIASLTQPQPEAREEDITRALQAAIAVMREDSPNEAAIDLCESALSLLAAKEGQVPEVCGNCVERMNCRMIHSGPASCEDYKLDEPAPKFETDGDAILELVTQLATIFATDQNGIAVYPDCIDRAVALLASHGQGERDEAAQEIRAAIALDKQTFEGVGRNTKGHARALMLIDEYRAALGQSSGEKS